MIKSLKLSAFALLLGVGSFAQEVEFTEYDLDNGLHVILHEQISKLKAADREELAAVDGITREKIEADEWVKQAKELLKNK